MRSLWWERTKVATLSIRMRSPRENLFESTGRKDVCEAHKKENYKVKMQFGDLSKISFIT